MSANANANANANNANANANDIINYNSDYRAAPGFARSTK